MADGLLAYTDIYDTDKKCRLGLLAYCHIMSEYPKVVTKAQREEIQPGFQGSKMET